MKGPLTRLKRLALRPLWTESALYRARRRCRTLIVTPFAALGGLTWGVFSAPAIGTGSQVLWGALGAFAFAFFMYLEQLLVPALAALANRIRLGAAGLAVVLWEAAVVSGLVYLVTGVFDAPLVPAVGTALGVGAFYALVFEYFLCGSGAANIPSLLKGTGGRAIPLPDQYSHADALVQRGEYDDAVGLYEEAIENNPREGAPYMRMARAFTKHGDHEGALASLRRGLMTARLNRDQDAFVVRQICEICSTKLGDPTQAVEDLRLLLERQPDGQHAEWASQELREIEEGFVRGSGADADYAEALPAPGETVDLDIEFTTQKRFQVDEDFEVTPEYAVGDDFVLGERSPPEEIFSVGGDIETSAADGGAVNGVEGVDGNGDGTGQIEES